MARNMQDRFKSVDHRNHRPRWFHVAAVAVPAALHCAAAAGSSGCWSEWPTNGHFYLDVHRPAGVTWQAGENHALALGGHLATITSASENTFVFGLVSSPTYWKVASNPTRILGPWLGGFQPPGSGEPLGSWTWLTGEPWSFSNWSPGEPNNWQGNQEDHLQFFTLGTVPAPKWNDLTGGSLMLGYVIELAGPPPMQPADFTCDATVDGADLAVLLSKWGQVDADADLDGDGVVNGADLAELLSEWGWPMTP